MKNLPSFVDESADGWIITGAIGRANDPVGREHLVLGGIKLLFKIMISNRFACWRSVEMRIVADGNLLARMDVFLSKEDGDSSCFVVDGGRIRLAMVVHSGDP